MLIWSFLANQAPVEVHSELLQNKLCFLAGLLLAAAFSAGLWRRNSDLQRTWQLLVLAVLMVGLSLLLVFLLRNSSIFESLCYGVPVGLLVGYALGTYRSSLAQVKG